MKAIAWAIIAAAILMADAYDTVHRGNTGGMYFCFLLFSLLGVIMS